MRIEVDGAAEALIRAVISFEWGARLPGEPSDTLPLLCIRS